MCLNIWGLQLSFFRVSWASKLDFLGSKSAQNPPKIDPGRVREPSGGPKYAPRAPREAQELAQSAPRPLQERPRAPQDHPREAQDPPKSSPKRPKADPRQLREPIQEETHEFPKFAFPCTRERSFQGSGTPKLGSLGLPGPPT